MLKVVYHFLVVTSSIRFLITHLLTRLGRDNEKIEYVNHIMKDTIAKSDTVVMKGHYVSYLEQLSHGSLPSFIFEEVLNQSLIDLPTDKSSNQTNYDDLLYLVSEYDLKTRMSSVF